MSNLHFYAYAIPGDNTCNRNCATITVARIISWNTSTWKFWICTFYAYAIPGDNTHHRNYGTIDVCKMKGVQYLSYVRSRLHVGIVGPSVRAKRDVFGCWCTWDSCRLWYSSFKYPAMCKGSWMCQNVCRANDVRAMPRFCILKLARVAWVLTCMFLGCAAN